MLCSSPRAMPRPFASLCLSTPLPAGTAQYLLSRALRSAVSRPCTSPSREVTTVLYFACVVAALLHTRTRVTSIGDNDLLKDLQWAVDRSCLDAATRALLREGLAAVGPASEQD